MCGIFCAINPKEAFSAKQVNDFKKSLEIINYRGPDASSFRTIEFSCQENRLTNIFMGHNRLSIIDLSVDGNQPFSYNDSTIIFNGEIYNYLEIREWLKSRGFSFRTNTDTEVILALYEYGGEEEFSRLNGMWAFIIFDNKRKKLVVSRDRFGEKPIYFYEGQDGVMYFSSEIKQLLSYTPKQVNSDVLSAYLNSYLLDYSNETFFKGIKKIEQGVNLVIDLDSSKKSEKKYWDFNLNNSLEHKKEEDLLAEFRFLLSDAIKIRLRSDVVVGNTLSGGLDSSAIAVLASDMMPKSFQNISVISKNKKVSEERYIDLLIKHNRLNVKKINFDEHNPFEDAEKVIWHHDEPILSVSTIAHYQMMKQLDNETDITVILSGQGGDEALAGYNKYFFFAIKEAFKNKEYWSAIKQMMPLFGKIGSEFNIKHSKRYTGIGGREGNIFNSILNLKSSKIPLSQFSNFKARQLQDYFKFSVPPLCHYEDRNSMAFSKEIRLPFLDHRLAEFCVNLPLDFKIRNGYTKYILRKSITELPKELAWRKDKKGFTLDEDLYFKGENLQYSRHILKNSLLGEYGFINQSQLNKSLISDLPTIWSRDLGRLVFAEIWLKKFFS